ncbi:MAG TPA: hypothetical protein VK808_05650 [Bacteroidia bacterium]|nr:hypothetical protein [Bacteroidia bacterium]
MNQTLWNIIKGTLLEGEKGSGKAMCALASMATIMFTITWDTVKDKPVDIGLILVLVGFINGLYAVKGWTAVQMNKNGVSTSLNPPTNNG